MWSRYHRTTGILYLAFFAQIDDTSREEEVQEKASLWVHVNVIKLNQ